MKTIAVAGTFDTKGAEFFYIKGLVEELGMKAFMIRACLRTGCKQQGNRGGGRL